MNSELFDFLMNNNLELGTISIENNDNILEIKEVIFNDPATIVYFNDGTKTVVKCGKSDTFDKEKGLAMALLKRIQGNDGSYNEIFKRFIKE